MVAGNIAGVPREALKTHRSASATLGYSEPHTVLSFNTAKIRTGRYSSTISATENYKEPGECGRKGAHVGWNSLMSCRTL